MNSCVSRRFTHAKNSQNNQIKMFKHYTVGRRRPCCRPPDKKLSSSPPNIVPSGDLIDAPGGKYLRVPITSQCMPPPPLAVLSPCVLCRSVSAHVHLTFLTLENLVLWPVVIPDDNAGS